MPLILYLLKGLRDLRSNSVGWLGMCFSSKAPNKARVDGGYSNASFIIREICGGCKLLIFSANIGTTFSDEVSGIF